MVARSLSPLLLPLPLPPPAEIYIDICLCVCARASACLRACVRKKGVCVRECVSVTESSEYNDLIASILQLLCLRKSAVFIHLHLHASESCQR